MQPYVLGRRLMKLGGDGMPGTGFSRLPSSARTILVDISEHRDTSITASSEPRSPRPTR
jgi:hypothetical protein